MATPTTLPAEFVAGTILTAAEQNDLRGAFRVLQVVYGTPISYQTNTSSSTFSDTGVTGTITPSSSDSKVLVLVNHNGCFKNSSDTTHQINLLRTATNIGAISRFAGKTSSSAEIGFGGVGATILDSPATTSATTYKTQHASEANSAVCGFGVQGAISTIILMEISA